MTGEEKIKLLKQAWAEVFEVEEVGDDADFFEEGGDSIKAVQLSSWLIQKGLKLDLGKIFYTPVLSQMSEALEETEPCGNGSAYRYSLLSCRCFSCAFRGARTFLNPWCLRRTRGN